MKIPFISDWLPFLDTSATSSSGPEATGDWLWVWQASRRSTKFFPTIGHVDYVDTLGHPWCFEGFGDALTMAVTQVAKSEVSVMLSNAAASLDGTRNKLLWDNDKQQFVAENGSGLQVDAKRLPGVASGEGNISFPGHLPENNVIMPTLIGLMSKFVDPSSLGSKLRSSTDLLCQLSDAEAEAQPFADNVYFCFLEDIVASTLICGQSEQKADCKHTQEEYVHTKEDFPRDQCQVEPKTLQNGLIPQHFGFHDENLHIPIILIDLLKSTKEQMLPRYISEDIALREALTYLVLFRTGILAASFSRKPYLCGADRINPPTLIPGWDLPFVITLKEEGDPIFGEKNLARDALPLVFVSQTASAPCSFVMTVRGTASMAEWVQDFDYWQTPFPPNPNILTHVGYMRYLSSVLPLLDDYLKRETKRHQCRCEETHLVFTGHSLGAGMAQQLALYFAERYGILACGADVAGVFFAPPRMFNDYGSERFRRIVNGRTILDVGDGLSYMPCYEGNAKHGWARCGRGHMSNPGSGRDYYADNYGLVEIEVEFMNASGGKGVDAFMQTLFPSARQGQPSVISSMLSKLVETAFPPLAQIPSLGVLGATHVCSFACKFSQAACGEKFKWWCSHCPMLI